MKYRCVSDAFRSTRSRHLRLYGSVSGVFLSSALGRDAEFTSSCSDDSSICYSYCIQRNCFWTPGRAVLAGAAAGGCRKGIWGVSALSAGAFDPYSRRTWRGCRESLGRNQRDWGRGHAYGQCLRSSHHPEAVHLHLNTYPSESGAAPLLVGSGLMFWSSSR